MSQAGKRPVDMGAVAQSIPTLRLQPYLDLCNGDYVQGINFYLWNIEISGAFWGSFNLLEVALRNSIHQQLIVKTGHPDWWDQPTMLHLNERLILEKVKEKFIEKGIEFDAGDLISELGLGFWVALLSNKYHQALWVNSLENAFPGYSGRRNQLYMDLDRLRKLRNRIAHHEPIYRRELSKDQESICEILGHLNREAKKLLKNLSRVPNLIENKIPKIKGECEISF